MPLNAITYQQNSRVNPITLGNVFIRDNFYSTMIQITYSEKTTVTVAMEDIVKQRMSSSVNSVGSFFYVVIDNDQQGALFSNKLDFFKSFFLLEDTSPGDCINY